MALLPLRIYPNPDRPELNIEEEILKICSIASLCLFNLIDSDPNNSIYLRHKSCVNMM
jgi:hypothetical protein